MSQCGGYRGLTRDGLPYALSGVCAQRLTGSRFHEVAEYGLEVRSAPTHLLTKAQKAFQACVLAGRPVVDAQKLSQAMKGMARPLYYLDFESVSPLDPPFAHAAPWQTIVTQYSLHACDDLGGALRHVDYLADPGRDCREDLALSLLRHLGDRGSIVVYSSYEKTQLKALAELLPHLAPPLEAVINRLGVWPLAYLLLSHALSLLFSLALSICRCLRVARGAICRPGRRRLVSPTCCVRCLPN